MRARQTTTYDAAAPRAQVRALRKDILWTAASFVWFGTSLLCFIVAAIISILSAAGILATSPAIANVMVGILIAAFVFASFGAHALDRLEEQARKDRSRES